MACLFHRSEGQELMIQHRLPFGLCILSAYLQTLLLIILQFTVWALLCDKVLFK